MPLVTEVGPDDSVLDGDPGPHGKGHSAAALVGLCLWPNGRPSQQLLSCCCTAHGRVSEMSRHALSLKITSSHKDLQGLRTIIQPHFLFVERRQTKISHHCSVSVIVNVAKLLSHVLLVNINLYYGRSTVCFRESAVFCMFAGRCRTLQILSYL